MKFIEWTETAFEEGVENAEADVRECFVKNMFLKTHMKIPVSEFLI